MNLTTRVACLISVLAFTGCQPRAGRSDVQERLLMQTSFEELGPWTKIPQPNLTTAKAHTGQVSMFVNAAHPYSATFHQVLGQLCDHRPRRFTFSAWVWVPSPDDDAVFVVAIANLNDPEHPIFRKEVFMTPTGRFEQWRQVSRSFELPTEIHANSELILYLWHSNAKDTVYTDDWQLTELW